MISTRLARMGALVSLDSIPREWQSILINEAWLLLRGRMCANWFLL